MAADVDGVLLLLLLAREVATACSPTAGSIARNFWEPAGAGAGAGAGPGAWCLVGGRVRQELHSFYPRETSNRQVVQLLCRRDREGWTAAGGRLPFLAPPLIPAGGFHMRFNRRGVVWLWYRPAARRPGARLLHVAGYVR